MPTPPSIGIPIGPIAFEEFTLTWAVFALMLLATTTLVLWLLSAPKQARNDRVNGRARRSPTITLVPRHGPRRVSSRPKGTRGPS